MAKGTKPTAWVVVNRMQVPPGGGAEYMAVENEIWKPVHEAAIAAGKRQGWAVYSRVLPYGADMRYSYATVDGFDNYSDLVAPGMQDLFRQAHPNATDAEFDKMSARTNASRTLLEGQLWHRLDYVNAETMGSN